MNNYLGKKDINENKSRFNKLSSRINYQIKK